MTNRKELIRSQQKRKGDLILPSGYKPFLEEIKKQICTAQIAAVVRANEELVNLYWQIGKAITDRQQKEGWGAGVIDHLAKDLRAAMAGVDGFSSRNLRRMNLSIKSKRPSLHSFLSCCAGQKNGLVDNNGQFFCQLHRSENSTNLSF